MNTRPLSVLLIEDDPNDARLLQEILVAARYAPISLTHAEQLAAGLDRLGVKRFDLILLDLALPDSTGLETFLRVRDRVPDLPVIVFVESDDALGVAAVQAGAQDYLVKGQVTGGLLIRAIRYAVERSRMQATLRSQSWTDDLTGLYNRRGFLELADQHIKLMQRLQKGLVLIYGDLAGLQTLNAQHGHRAGDQALQAAAEILQRTFRGSDLIARVGSDEFAVLVLAASTEAAPVLIQRLHNNFAKHGPQSGAPYSISMTVSATEFNATVHPTPEGWLAAAEAALRQ